MNKNLPALTALMLAFALIITLFGNFLNQSVLSFADCERSVYLTFDDGPSDRVTPKILDVLKDEKVKATFFIVGEHAKTRKELLKREFEEGHTVAIHSYSHKYSNIYANSDSLLSDIAKCNDIICAATGQYSSLYRFPGGSFSLPSELVSAVTSAGYRYVDWNASFRDSELKNATADELAEAAVKTVSNKDNVVLLAHDATDKSATAEALRKVIKYFKGAGYSFKRF